MQTPTEPCPIPSCAMEWSLALTTAVIGAALMTLNLDSQIVKALTLAGNPRASTLGVALFLLSAGVLQGMALLWGNKAAQRWSAFWCAFVLGDVTFMLGHYRGWLVLGAITLTLAVQEVYVFCMLQGARWRDAR